MMPIADAVVVDVFGGVIVFLDICGGTIQPPCLKYGTASRNKAILFI